MLSHEFRTPLVMIHSAAQMIRFRETAMASGSQERLERIEGTARRLSALIDVFLASDALDQGKIVLTPREGEMSVMVERVLPQFGGQSRRIQVAQFPPIRLIADHDLLGVALRNCLANALNYSPPQSPVWLSLSVTDGTVSICVRDEGPGIPAEEMEHIGTPYYRGRHSAHKSGSGLGISMVRTIIQAHGGAMTVQSTLGAGTSITLSLRDFSAPSPA
jgi:signal transduction histidine kinase